MNDLVVNWGFGCWCDAVVNICCMDIKILEFSGNCGWLEVFRHPILHLLFNLPLYVILENFKVEKAKKEKSKKSQTSRRLWKRQKES